MKNSLLFAFALCLSFSSVSAQDLIPLVQLPAGSFYMGGLGNNENFDEVPVHKVTFSQSIKMGKTEITNAQYEMFCPEHRALRGKNGVSFEDDEAVVNVSYDDALAFCKWLSEKEGKTYRLPTEAEWEYACKAGTYWEYYTGDGLDGAMCKNQNIIRELGKVSLKVGQTRPNAFGLYDMHGNVEEWCLDWYGPYIEDEQTDPVGYSTGMARVTRGGSHNTPHKYLRSTNRMAMLPQDKHELTGFRVVQAEYPKSEALKQPVYPNTVSQKTFVWQKVTEPVFMEPKVYVLPPKDNHTPFYSHNHQPAVTWCENGDILVIWFSANQENEREMTVLQSRLVQGGNEWQPATEFYRIADRNLTGSSLMNDGKGTLYHMNGMERAGDWQNLALTYRKSTDNGMTWSIPELIAPEHTVHHQVIQGPSVLKNGWFIQACDAGPGGADGTALFLSKDGGKTWTDQSEGKPWGEVKEGGKGAVI
ncbi:MAG: SUMF1/EgtB/PvdO family nonheme iron enzyme, partial [Bacteroidales bacterium]|nr:SUMF1/EgtB/PvdO family nonheme iron enzyme [Bacteroidales bacterium]